MKYPSNDTGMTWRNSGGNNGGNKNNFQRLPAFQPGQLDALSSQLNAGFGGGVADWKADLRNTYDPSRLANFNYGGGNGGGNRNGGGNQPGSGGNNNGGGQPTGGGFDPSRPRHMAMPMNRPMQMQAPQMGLLNAPMQQPQQRGLLGDIPPEVVAFLSNNMRR